jgi:hypothetical protein
MPSSDPPTPRSKLSLATQKEKLAAKEREQARAKAEREVDDELAALKKKIRGP